jgi:hypothetical protein
MLKIESTPYRNLDELANEHFKNLKDSVEKAINRYSTGKELEFLHTNIKGILIDKPAALHKINSEYRKKFLSNRDFDESDKLKLKKIFSYKNFKNVLKKYNARELAKKLKVDVCPYCNLQYTTTVKNNKGRVIARPDFDHFFCQDKFPLLGISFYNLIPSCTTCNNIKGEKVFDLNKNMHVYLEGFNDDFTFTYLPTTPNGCLGFSTEFEIRGNIKPDCANKDKIDGNYNELRLKEVYQEHKDHVKELIKKHYMTDGKYLECLAASFPNVFSPEKEVYQLAFANYAEEEDFLKRPLAKLYKDINEQLRKTAAARP